MNRNAQREVEFGWVQLSFRKRRYQAIYGKQSEGSEGHSAVVALALKVVAGL